MKFRAFVLLALVFFSCKNEGTKKDNVITEKANQNIITEQYELIRPPSEINGLLVLFGGYPEKPADIKREFRIEELAVSKGIAIMYVNFSRRLWLEENEKQYLVEILEDAMDTNNIPTTNIYIGGFSSGGNVSQLLANELIKIGSSIKPKGVFIVDSPVDLLELYRCSQRNIERSHSDVSQAESQNWSCNDNFTSYTTIICYKWSTFYYV